MDRRAFLRALGLTTAATAALLVPGTEAWAEILEPRRRWWQGWSQPQQTPFGAWGTYSRLEADLAYGQQVLRDFENGMQAQWREMVEAEMGRLGVRIVTDNSLPIHVRIISPKDIAYTMDEHGLREVWERKP